LNKMERVSKKIYFFLILIILVLVFSNSIVRFITDFLWFDSLGYLGLFTTEIFMKLGIFFPSFVVVFLGLTLYIKKLFINYAELGQVVYTAEQKKLSRRISSLASVVFSAYFSFSLAQSLWLLMLQYLNRTSFNASDPIFSYDISFYVFTMPLLNGIFAALIGLVLGLIILTGGFYFVMMRVIPPAEGSLYDYNEITARPNFRSIFRKDLVMYGLRKIAIFGTIFFVLLSAYFYLRGFYLMYSPRGVAFGASYTDINVTLLGYRILAVVSLVGAPAFAYGILKNKKIFMGFAPVLIVLIFISMTGIATVVQQLVVEPDELSKEREYLTYAINHTQEGYNLSEVEEIDYPALETINAENLFDNETTINNIRINDARPLKQTFNQIQVIRLYYEFNDIDIDRYVIDGKYTQVFIAPRELNVSRLTESAQTWINLHLKYTHGYGVVMAPVNRVTEEGQPELIISNVPPVTDSDLVLTRPEIYFGELTNHYIIVNSEEKEFDYPSGSDNRETLYEGTAGIEMGIFNRVLFAIREASMKMLFSNNINSDSRIVINRNIMDRVKTLAPFIEFDKNPYLVIEKDSGRLYWIIDGYSVTDKYPYSEIYNFNGKGVNYIRNSVKTVVDAYNGDVNFYIYDEEDPVIKTYANIFPGVFKSKEQMPEDLKNHVKYPQDFFNLQAEVYKEYHVSNPNVFYNGEDVWDIANEKFMEGLQQIESNYVMFRLPERQDIEFNLILPYTPRQKPNMTSLLVGRSDYEEYGKLFIYRLPKDRTIDGPMMIESRIDQDSVISPQFSLWGQEGSEILRGNVVIVPIENSLLYVEPIYIESDNENAIPEMKRVIVAYGNRIAMEKNLEDALMVIFGEREQTPVPGAGLEQGTLEELSDKYQELKEYVEEIEKLIEELLQEPVN